MTVFWLVVLLSAANGAPVLAHRLLRDRCSQAIDGGRLWHDGRPLLGRSKTWRGLVSGTACCGLLAALLGFGLLFGTLFGFLALFGDLCSSFIKRRLGLAPSARATGLDQIPEALLPVLMAKLWLDLGWWQVISATALFVAANIGFSPLLYRLGIRKQPH